MNVVVPLRTTDCEYRRLAWELCREQWLDRGITPIETDDGGEVFSRGGSINQAVEALEDNAVVVVVDADLMVDMDAIDEAVRVAGEAPGLVQPYDRIRYFDEAWQRVEWDFRASSSTPLFGAANVFTKETWRRAGGFLAAFRGWGCEDIAFVHQCAVMVAPWRRVTGTIDHLWHPKTGAYVAVDNHDLLAQVTGAETPNELAEVIDALSA